MALIKCNSCAIKPIELVGLLKVTRPLRAVYKSCLLPSHEQSDVIFCSKIANYNVGGLFWAGGY